MCNRLIIFILILAGFLPLSIYSQSDSTPTKKDTLSTNAPIALDTTKKITTAIADTVVKKDITSPSTVTDTTKKTDKEGPKMPLETEFTFESTKLKKGEIISNVLKIYNTTDKEIEFFLELDYPAGWKFLSKDITYKLPPKDTLYIPIRIIPKTLISGNTKYLVNAFLFDKNNEQVGFGAFNANSESTSMWTMTALPGNTLYYRNDENVIPFKLNLFNIGTEKQDLLLTLNGMQPNNFILDTTDLIIKRPYYTFSLNSAEDTTFSFKYKFEANARNHTRIDLEGYRPNSLTDGQNFSLYATSSEPKSSKKNVIKRGQKINFIKLPNSRQVSLYNNNVLPLSVDFNVNNVLNYATIASLSLRGMTDLKPDHKLIYSFQTNYSNYLFNKVLDNSMYYLGYFFKKGNIQIGNVSGGAMGLPNFGRGLKGEYNITKRHKVLGFLVRNPTFFNGGKSNIDAYGLGYEFKYLKENKIHIDYAHSDNNIAKLAIDALNFRISYSYKRHSISFASSATRVVFKNGTGLSPRTGHYERLSYNGLFFNSKLQTNHMIGYSTEYYANNNFDRLVYNNRSRYVLSNKWNLVLTNNVNNYNSKIYPSSFTWHNQFNAVYKNSANSTIQPFVFYSVYDYFLLRYHSRGIGFMYNSFDIKDNTRFSITTKAGYNHVFNYKIQDIFRFQINGLLFYKTFSVNARYFYGGNSTTDQLTIINQKKNPQSIYISLQNQYTFKNSHFVLQNGINYSYLNLFQQHNINLFPELYYFTYSGWRFKINCNLNLLISKSKTNIYNQQITTISSDDDSPTYTNNFNLGFGVRKDFGIPIPFVKRKTFKVNVVSFLDLNGNGKHEKNEQTLENVIVRINSESIITNDKGEGGYTNLPLGNYKVSATPLDEVIGWFYPNEDSLSITKDMTINIAYVRGVKVKGKVVLDRERIGADNDKPFDLSRIKITAANGKIFNTLTDFEGNFEFYLPYGKYTITMDEGVLSEKFTLVKNNYTYDIDSETEGLYVSFFIIEKKRKINKKKF